MASRCSSWTSDGITPASGLRLLTGIASALVPVIKLVGFDRKQLWNLQNIMLYAHVLPQSITIKVEQAVKTCPQRFVQKLLSACAVTNVDLAPHT